MYQLFHIFIFSCFCFSGHSSAIQEQRALEPTPNRYGFFLSDNNFYTIVVDEVFKKAESLGKDHPVNICEPGAGKGAFLERILKDKRNKKYPVRYTASELQKERYEDLQRVIDSYSTNPLNRFGKAKRGNIRDFLPGKNSAYDLITPFMMLHFIPPWQMPKLLNDIHASLKPEGLFIGMIKVVSPAFLNPLERPFYQELGKKSLWPSFYKWTSIGQECDKLMEKLAYCVCTKNSYSVQEIVMTDFLPIMLEKLLTAFGFRVEICEEYVEQGLYFDAQKVEHFNYIGFIAHKDDVVDRNTCEAYEKEGRKLEFLIKEKLTRFGIPIPENW